MARWVAIIVSFVTIKLLRPFLSFIDRSNDPSKGRFWLEVLAQLLLLLLLVEIYSWLFKRVSGLIRRTETPRTGAGES
jgi:hypothetical protein